VVEQHLAEVGCSRRVAAGAFVYVEAARDEPREIPRLAHVWCAAHDHMPVDSVVTTEPTIRLERLAPHEPVEIEREV
jgi:hypothetical protein